MVHTSWTDRVSRWLLGIFLDNQTNVYNLELKYQNCWHNSLFTHICSKLNSFTTCEIFQKLEWKRHENNLIEICSTKIWRCRLDIVLNRFLMRSMKLKNICLTSLTRAKCGVRSTLCWKNLNISGSIELFAL